MTTDRSPLPARRQRAFTVMLGISSFLAVQLFLAQSARAQAPADFYKGKTIELDISSSVGGGYDAYARMLARHIGRFIPGNPAVVAKNMESKGSSRRSTRLRSPLLKGPPSS